MSEHKEPIPSMIYNAAVGGHVTNSQQIIDENENKEQSQINAEIKEALGTGGSVNDRIAEEGAKHYLKEETYNKSELNNMITTPNQEYVSVTATAETTAVTDVLPSTGAADTTYRVGNWDGTQYNDSIFSEYAWNGSAYIKLSTKSQIGEIYDISANHADTKYANLADALGTNGDNIPPALRKGGMSIKFVQSYGNKYIQARCMAQNFTTDVTQWQSVDDVPTIGSENLVKSDGVAQMNTIEIVTETISDIYEAIFHDGETAPDTDYIVVELNLGTAYNSLNVALATNTSSTYITTNIYSGAGIAGKYVWKVPYNGEKYIRFWTQTSYPANSTFKLYYTDVIHKLWRESLEALNLPKAIDNVPTANSNNFVKSGGVKAALDNVAFSTHEKVKEVGIDEKPTSYSNNLIKSGGVFKQINLIDESFQKGRTYNLFNKENVDIKKQLAIKESTHTFVYGSTTDLIVIPINIQQGQTVQFISNYNSSHSFTCLAVISNNIPAQDVSWIAKSACVASSTQLRGYLQVEQDATYLIISVTSDDNKDEIIKEISENLCVAVHNDSFEDYSVYPYIPYTIRMITKNNLVRTLYDKIENAASYEDSLPINLGPELMLYDNKGTYTNWSGNLQNGYTHTAGSDGRIMFDQCNTTDVGKFYLVRFNVTYTENEFGTIYIGDGYRNKCYNGTNYIEIVLKSDGGYLRLSPVSNLTFTISNISVRKIVEGGEPYILQDICRIVSPIDEHPTNYGFWNVLLGKDTLGLSPNSTRSIAIGMHTLGNLKGGHRNIAIGTFAMSETQGGEDNISIGCDSMISVKNAIGCVTIGKAAMERGSSCEMNIAVGGYSLGGKDGEASLGNTAVGYFSGASTHGFYNTMIGWAAGYDNRDGTGNVCLGKKAYSGNNSNTIVIGTDITASASNEIKIGNKSNNLDYIIIGNKKILFNKDGSVTWEVLS